MWASCTRTIFIRLLQDTYEIGLLTMSKSEKGILGFKKDPKNKILFSFGSGADNELWPSDESDSDYEPNEEQTEILQSRVKG